jgi:O6-methylguanine-DNA--protein-cysteine methyltransferase
MVREIDTGFVSKVTEILSNIEMGEQYGLQTNMIN